ncbi:hypothetical protein [Rhodococcus sp. Chr-9]|uniref:hypothetical protein n=1 Tax=Rhodococcus sp. Chr-9 TaxID=713612 RepID=UPI001269EFD5|nr:hypothetical protein [Rhodococcus sp. Chr-9]
MGLADDFANFQRQMATTPFHPERGKIWEEMNQLVKEFIPLAIQRKVRTTGWLTKSWCLPISTYKRFDQTSIQISAGGEWRYFSYSDGRPNPREHVLASSAGPEGCTTNREDIEDMRGILLDALNRPKGGY